MKLNTVIIEDEIPAARLLHSMVSSLRPEWNIEIIPAVWMTLWNGLPPMNIPN